MSSEDVAGFCVVLETVSKDNVGGGDLEKYRDALEGLLELLKSGEQECVEVRPTVGKEEWARLVVVSAGHVGRHYWTDSTSRRLARELLHHLCVLKGCSVPGDLFAGDKVLLDSVMAYIRGNLKKNNWREKFVVKQALAWLLRQLKHPHVGAQLDFSLPPVLWMLDDYSDYNRVLAMQLITHLLQNTDPTELRWHGRADVLYEALHPLLYVGSVEVVLVLYPCLLALLPVVDYCPTPSVPAKICKADEVFSILVTNLAREPKLSLKRALSAQVPSYIQYLGIYTIRHIKDLLPVLLSLLEHEDPEKEQYRRNSLEGLLSLISCCWPRMSVHQVQIITALAELAEHTDSDDVHQLVVKCLSLLVAAVPELKEESSYLFTCCEHHPGLLAAASLAAATSSLLPTSTSSCPPEPLPAATLLETCTNSSCPP